MIVDASVSPRQADRSPLIRAVCERFSVAGDPELAWQRLPRGARLYVVAVFVAGLAAFVPFLPIGYPQPLVFAGVLAAACITSTWKVNLPIPLGSGATLSVSYAANLMALLLLGASHAMVIAVAGVWVQCTVGASRRYPWYRTAFSMAAEAITMAATVVAYASAGGGSAAAAFAVAPIAVAIVVYFVANTGLVAAAVALSTGRDVGRVWRDDFLWSGLSFVMSGTVGAAAALVAQSGHFSTAAIGAVPIYLTYRTYRWFVQRLAGEKTLTSAVATVLSDQAAAIQKQYRDVLELLLETQMSERELAAERERLVRAMAEMAHLQEMRDRALEQEQAAREHAERANRVKDHFLATVSHELRTPLSAILGWADMLRSGTLDGDRRAKATHAIYTSARHQARLVDELLDVARIMAGKLPLECAAVDVRDVARRAVEGAQPAADAKRIHLAFDEEPSPGVVYGDATRLQQVVANLLANALKFTPEGGAIDVQLRRDGDVAELAVRDTGEGIAAEFLSSVFEPFRQADGSTTRRHGGLGLGLSIVKHLVEVHHGTVHAESEGVGHGATFTVRLPLADVSSDQVESIAAESAVVEPAAATHSLAGLTVLVVDDDDECRQVTAANLEQHGASVLTAGSAAEALQVLQCEPVSVLLADVGMPGEDGYALIRQLRALRAATASIPSAAVTAFAGDDDRRRALAAGFDAHVAKPLDARALVSVVVSLSSRTRGTAAP